jgi:hypothetical protein
MKKNKKERKEEKKIRSIVSREFTSRDKDAEKKHKKFKTVEDKAKDALVDSITKSVLVNKAVLKRDKKAYEESAYFETLFSDFQKMVQKLNNKYQFKANDLLSKIDMRKSELKRLKAEIAKLEAEKELKKHD